MKKSELRQLIREVIGAESRCTNLVAASLGICSQKPLIRWNDMMALLSSFAPTTYTKIPAFSVAGQDSSDTSTLFLAPLSKSDQIEKFEPVKFSDVSTVKKLIAHIKSIHFQGVIIVHVSSHVLAIHSWGSNVYVVDALEKFSSSQRVQAISIITDPSARTKFTQWISSEKKLHKIKKV